MSGSFENPQITLKALSYFEDGDLGTLVESTKNCLAEAARRVDLDRLPAVESLIQASPGNPEPPQ